MPSKFDHRTFIRLDHGMPENRKFMEESNPWALHGIAERLLEASQRELWKEPDPELLAALQQAYLDTEGDLEDR